MTCHLSTLEIANSGIYLVSRIVGNGNQKMHACIKSINANSYFQMTGSLFEWISCSSSEVQTWSWPWTQTWTWGINMIIGRFMFCVMSHSGHVSPASHSLSLTEKHDNIPILRPEWVVSVSEGPRAKQNTSSSKLMLKSQENNQSINTKYFVWTDIFCLIKV